MYAKNLFQKETHAQSSPGNLTSSDLDPRLVVHYGIPSTASILAFDRIQRLLAIGTLDGRIKVIGGDNIEGLLISPKQLPFKNLEFLQNQGFLVSVSNENDIQVWNLEFRCLSSTLPWESNITAFSVINGTSYIYVGDEHGLLSVLKFDADEEKLIRFPYCVTANSLSEAAGLSIPDHHSVVGVLPQPHSHGNRVLIAYENGLVILWDVSDNKVVCARGHKDLQPKDIAIPSDNNAVREISDNTSDSEQEDKEISSLCWVTSDGSILAVGYVDGDILLWNLPTDASARNCQAGKSSHNVVRLQLSSVRRRLPVIVLHCHAKSTHSNHRGQLFLYGGDEIGSEEVLTILSIDWSSDIENLKCIARLDLTLHGSFADMILLPNAGAIESSQETSLFVLTSPGQLHFYDDACLYGLFSQQEKRPFVPAVQYPLVIPVAEPCMTVGKLSFVDAHSKFSRTLLETALNSKNPAGPKQTSGNLKWPLTGGVPNQIFSFDDDGIQRLYIAGYQDGSIRIWDATYPTLSLVSVKSFEVKGFKGADASVSVSALDFCSITLSIAVGRESGVVCLFQLIGSSDESTLHFVTKTEHTVHQPHQETGDQCTAVFSVLDSPVCILQFADSGNRLAVGFSCGRVAMLDISSFSVIFVTDCVSGSSSPIISLVVHMLASNHGLTEDPTNSESKNLDNLGKRVFCILTRDAHIGIVDYSTGNVIYSSTHPKKASAANSMYILGKNEDGISASKEKLTVNSFHNSESKNEPNKINAVPESLLPEVEGGTTTEDLCEEIAMDPNILLCCEDSLCLYSLKSLLQGEDNSIRKVNLIKPCSWTAIFQKDKKCGLVVLYWTGDIEIRSLPDLKVLSEISLISVLRWNFKTSMEKTMSSINCGHITLVNGCEFAIISLLSHENDFRIPESLPCLHDTVLAAAADTSIFFTSEKKKTQVTAQRILGGILKGLKGDKLKHDVSHAEAQENNFVHLNNIFSGKPDLSTAVNDSQEVLDLDIDDIEIDEPVISSSSHKSNNNSRDKDSERDRLFEGATSEPKLRTPAEIMAKYRKAGDASEAAARAKDKLAERGEKLERINRRTAELQDGAENFASMAAELAKTMEKRSKWWNI